MIYAALRSRLAGAAMAVVIAGAALAACSGAATPAPAGGITVTGAWARASSAMASAGAAYATIKNAGGAADALVGAESPAAGTVEVHETYMMEASPNASASGGMGGAGAMGMRPIKRLEIPAGGSVELKPGSYHIMMIGLKQDLKTGDKIDLTLVFEKAGKIAVQAEVRTN